MQFCTKTRSLKTNYCCTSHRFPLYYLNVVLGLTAARTLLERFKSKSYNLSTQVTYVSRHPGT